VNPGMIAAIAAVLVDSVVTGFVGWRLMHGARSEIAAGVQDIIDNAPALLVAAMVKQQEVEENGE
jgi:hypothetical protein